MLVAVGGALLWLRVTKAKSEDVRFVEVAVDELQSVSVNHRQGSIGFTLKHENYFYYVSGSTESERTVAASTLLADLQRASTVQIRSERYGLHRLVTNLLLFYGQRSTPSPLSPELGQEPGSEQRTH